MIDSQLVKFLKAITLLHDLPLPQTKNKAVVEETEKKKEDDAKVVNA